MDPSARTAAATAKHVENTIRRALDDPVRLERAAAIVRAALARKKLRLADLTPDGSDAA